MADGEGKLSRRRGFFYPEHSIEMALRRAFSLGINFGSTKQSYSAGRVLARENKYDSLSLSRPHFGLQFSQHYELLFWERGRVGGGGR